MFKGKKGYDGAWAAIALFIGLILGIIAMIFLFNRGTIGVGMIPI